MPRRRVIVLLSLLASLAAAIAPAQARTPRPLEKSPLLWATINICDTADHPDTVGIRGSMPGTGDRRERMWMRIQLQYLSAKDGAWHNLGPAGDSGWRNVGSAKYKVRQAGQNFTVTPPQNGKFTLRGAVTFEWRRGDLVVHRARKRTTANHAKTANADPPGFSEAACAVTK